MGLFNLSKKEKNEQKTKRRIKFFLSLLCGIVMVLIILFNITIGSNIFLSKKHFSNIYYNSIDYLEYNSDIDYNNYVVDIKQYNITSGNNKYQEFVSIIKEYDNITDLLINNINLDNLFFTDDCFNYINNISNNNINCFKQTKLYKHLLFELSYQTFKYVRNTPYINKYKSDINNIIKNNVYEYSNDLSIFYNTDINNHPELIDEFINKLSEYAHYNYPNIKANYYNINLYLRFIIKTSFSLSHVGLSFFGIVISFALMSMLYMRLKNDMNDTFIDLLNCFIIGIVISLGLSIYLNIKINSGYNYHINFGYYLGFYITIILEIGLYVFLYIINFKHNPNVKKQKIKRDISKQQVPDVETTKVMQELGMFTGMFQDHDEQIIDYYGDGRGIKLQQEYQKNKKEKLEKASNDDDGYIDNSGK